MEKIKLYKTDLNVSRINLGGNVFGWTLNEQQSFEILDAFVEAGGNFIDTADAYGWWTGRLGISETIIGNWMKSRRNRKEMVIATKVGSELSHSTSPNLSAEHIARSSEQSLKRLQTDYIDLYYTHFDDEFTPIDVTLEAYNRLVKAGKVRHIGASNISPRRLKESFQCSWENNFPPYIALQPHYNLLERKNYEMTYAPIAEEFNLSVFPYFSLASGFLTGKYRSKADIGKSIRGGVAEMYLNQKGLSLLDTLDIISAKHGATPATVALSWLLHQDHIMAPIASATDKQQLKAIIAAPSLKLDSVDLNWLDAHNR
ncbi:MAG: aldo/keto reductase [Sphingobacterium sp.]|jgi:aryl-alcohol dehydrogenase-like predicted oxidoreductase|nr:aldo/keto reductase [Sphingobacterium sp.]